MDFKVYDYTEKQLLLKRKFGCGTSLIGKSSINEDAAFRREIIVDRSNSICRSDTSEVKYEFFCILFLPIFPLGCYRVQTLYRYSWHEVGEITRIQGEEKPKTREIISIYLHHYIIAAIAVTALLYFVFAKE